MSLLCRPFVACWLCLAFPLVRAERVEWVIDENHSSVTFAITFNVMMEAVGNFGNFSGTIVFDPEASGETELGAVTAEIDITSLITGNHRRDDHLQAEDFFNTAVFPRATFTSTGWIAGSEASTSTLTGDLTIIGNTAPVTLQVVWGGTELDRRGREVGHWTATGTFNRRDWGIEYGATIGDEVRLTLDIHAIARGEAKAVETETPVEGEDATGATKPTPGPST